MSDLARFEAMLQLSQQMVDAAIANDWDRLVALEKAEAELRASLQSSPHASNDTIPSQDHERIAALIRTIQANHAKVHDNVAPWLDSVRHLLAQENRERSVRERYGAFTQAP